MSVRTSNRCHRRSATGILALATILLAAVWSGLVAVSGTAGAQATEPAVVLTTDEGGSLAWSDSKTTVAGSATVAWDLRGLDAGRSRSDLVRIRLEGFEGPGRFVATAATPFRNPEVLLDADGGIDEFVVQVGRTGSWHWAFDAPGTYRLRLHASFPAANGGLTDVGTSLDVTVTEGSVLDAPASGTPARHDRAEPLLAAGPVVEAGAAPQQIGSGTVVIDAGHVDMGPRIVDGAWRVQLRDDSTSPVTWRELSDVVLQAHDNAQIQVPPGDAYAFLGNAGDTVYVLPQVQQADIVWPGWNTQDASVLGAVPGSTTWRLRGVDGPGRFILYSTGSFGQSVVMFDSANELPQELEILRNTHVHGNWAFTEPGVYHLTIEMTATDSGGTTLTDTRTLAFAVGDATDASSAFPPAGGGGGTPVTTPPGAPTSTAPGGPTSTTPTGGDAVAPKGGSIASTGIAQLTDTVGIAVLFVVAGGVLLLVRRRPRHALSAER